uniref:hydroxyacylglutathione hydrolase n=1 Tax=Phallusia mammillata TaxID=59560 RepID=A0A6F9DF60_9ASCI|nr:hydroxyacylglutathione hydrolase, mitochondrial-like [Phallusia mammillata]
MGFLTARLLGQKIWYHSKELISYFANMKVRIIPALEDNYMYLLIDEKTNQAAAVDPVEPDKIIAATKEENVNLTTVFTTHHHWDHAGGNKDLVSRVKGLDVYAGDDRIDGMTKKVNHGQSFNFGSLTVQCLSTPCHTSGHICYFVEGGETPVVFTGDTLFLSGCGKFFEGTAEQMHRALVDILGALPADTKVYCGHEYSVGSLTYSAFVDPENQTLQNKLKWAKQQRQNGLPTIPSTIGEELLYNPFMRVNDLTIQKRCGTKNGIETMGFLRNEKNTFKPKV